MSRPAPRRSASAPAASCCPTTRRWSSPSSSARWPPLHPGRIDLGLGRAPGTDMVTARALRRNLDAGVDSFPQDVVELMGYFRPAEPGQRVRAVPGEGQEVAVWILGSSTYGAQLAAMLGLPYAFASHFAPAEMEHAIDIYRSRFQPSEQLDKPYADARPQRLRRRRPTRRRGCCSPRCSRPSSICAPAGPDSCRRRSTASSDARSDGQGDARRRRCRCAVVGSPETVRRGIDAFIRRTGADELMVTAQIFDHQARRALVRDPRRRAPGIVAGGVGFPLAPTSVANPKNPRTRQLSAGSSQPITSRSRRCVRRGMPRSAQGRPRFQLRRKNPTSCRMSKQIAGPEIERLIQLLAKVPGLGPRSARRAALHLIKKKEQLLAPLAAAMAEAVDKVRVCSTCGNVDTVDPCIDLHRPAARRLDHHRGRGRRRFVGAGARRRHERPLPRARRHAVAARRHRPRRAHISRWSTALPTAA